VCVCVLELCIKIREISLVNFSLSTFDEIHFSQCKKVVGRRLSVQGGCYVRNVENDKKSTTPGIPNKSPMQVLTGPDTA
jgi:hypothetical protein